MTMKYWFLICIILSGGVGTDIKAQNAEEVLQKMFRSIDGVNTLTYEFRQKERMENHWSEATVKTRMQVQPKQIYVKTVTPDEGIELLWVDGKYGGKALINPNGFPYFNVKLSPTGGQLLGMQHHPVTDAGFGKFKKVLQKALSRSKSNPAVKMNVTGSRKHDGKDCYVLEIVDDNFHFYDYTVKQGENLFSIAKKLGVAEYMMMVKNSGVDDYFDVRAGQTIQVPSSYAMKTILYIAKDSMLPVFMKMEDKEGLFELYEFNRLQVNPSFSSTEFDENHNAYGF